MLSDASNSVGVRGSVTDTQVGHSASARSYKTATSLRVGTGSLRTLLGVCFTSSEGFAAACLAHASALALPLATRGGRGMCFTMYHRQF